MDDSTGDPKVLMRPTRYYNQETDEVYVRLPGESTDGFDDPDEDEDDPVVAKPASADTDGCDGAAFYPWKEPNKVSVAYKLATAELNSVRRVFAEAKANLAMCAAQMDALMIQTLVYQAEEEKVYLEWDKQRKLMETVLNGLEGKYDGK